MKDGTEKEMKEKMQREEKEESREKRREKKGATETKETGAKEKGATETGAKEAKETRDEAEKRKPQIEAAREHAGGSLVSVDSAPSLNAVPGLSPPRVNFDTRSSQEVRLSADESETKQLRRVVAFELGPQSKSPSTTCGQKAKNLEKGAVCLRSRGPGASRGATSSHALCAGVHASARRARAP
ncbi:UNVERIFIED_CONTAM: hypothetical protein HHA_453230 [Hammondia hammondi]|eukprot:XP_008886490.1 hypothetical protein HHA_453230 [Hammondia hammondi]